jgi:hypothetical protein
MAINPDDVRRKVLEALRKQVGPRGFPTAAETLARASCAGGCDRA